MRAAIDVTAGDGLAERAAIFGDRIDQTTRRTSGRLEVVRTLATVPAVVAATLDGVHLLERTLPDVGEPERAVGTVEAPAPGIAQAPRVDLRTFAARTRTAGRARRIGRERVVRGNRVARPRRADLDAQHLPEQRRQALAVLLRVASAAAIAGAEIQIAIRTEGEVAAVVIVSRLVDRQQILFRGWVDRRRAAGVDSCGERGESTDHAAVDVVDEYARVGGESGMERHAEKPGLALRDVERTTGDVEHGRRAGRVRAGEAP